MVACRLPQYVKDPLHFKPERWIRGSEHYENIHPFLSLPFGFGPRACIARRLAEQNMCITIIRVCLLYCFQTFYTICLSCITQMREYARMGRTHNRRVYSQARYRCATTASSHYKLSIEESCD